MHSKMIVYSLLSLLQTDSFTVSPELVVTRIVELNEITLRILNVSQVKFDLNLIFIEFAFLLHP